MMRVVSEPPPASAPPPGGGGPPASAQPVLLELEAPTSGFKRLLSGRKGPMYLSLSPSEIVVAHAQYLQGSLRFAPGAVAPFPLPGVDRVLIDQSLLSHSVVWVGAGSPTHMASVSPGDLVRLARAQPVDAVQDSTYHSA